MNRHVLWLAGIMVAITGLTSSAEITVPAGFTVDILLDNIDGTPPRLEAIRNPEYGFGVVAASVDEGILNVLRISQSSVDVLGSISGMPADAEVYTTRFDTTGLFSGELYVSVVFDTGGTPSPDHTDILRVRANGQIDVVASLGHDGDRLALLFDFTAGTGGYLPGAYLEDRHAANGTSLYHMDAEYNTTLLGQNVLPSGRTDLDVRGMAFDPTGIYGSYLTFADSDPNHDDLSVIYQLLPDLTWSELTTPVSTSARYYWDMAFSTGGAFGSLLYVADTVTDTVMTVDTNGVHNVFASGFTEIESVTVSEDGEHLFASDQDGVYRIRAVTTTVGPTILMREPLVEADDVHTGPAGVDSLRVLWSERLIFDNTDLTIVDGDGAPVPFSVSGSNSQFMIIVFGTIMLNNKFTITVSDSVVSAETGAAIDGDNDGMAGGDAIFVVEHRIPFDDDQDGDVDLEDYAAFEVCFAGPDQEPGCP